MSTSNHEARDASIEPAAPASAPPLGKYNGAEPPAEEWFTAALERQPERLWVNSRGSILELLTWGEVGKPGLVFVHGTRAQADWWSFIAPFFADDFRIAAFSSPGMGHSEWRDQYDFNDLAADAEAISDAAGLGQSKQRPFFVGHSFGGSQVLFLAGHHPEQMSGAILVDTSLRGPSRDGAAKHQALAGLSRRTQGKVAEGHRVYATLTDALVRFRLMPPQSMTNDFIVDYIARRLLEPVTGDGDAHGWRWRYDPDYWGKFNYDVPLPKEFGRSIIVPVAHIHGQSSYFRQEPDRPDVLPKNAIEFDIPSAHHHVMIDQPIALVTAIRAVLAAWAST